TVTATRRQLPILSGIWVKDGFNVNGSAIAIVSGGAGPGNCLLALGKQTVRGVTTTDAPDAIQVSGGGSAINILMPGCGAFSNSTACGGEAILLNGNFKFYAGSVGTAGCVRINGSHTLGESPQPSSCTVSGVSQCTDNYTQGSGQIADPYSGMTTCP